MDGLDTSNNGVIVMAATNRLELLDPALLRAGRFDRIIQCPLPDKNGREAILRVHCKKLSLSMDVDLARVARLTPGTSGADLSAVCNEAAIRAARRNAITINSSDFDGAIESFLSGRTAQVGSLIEGAANNLFPWLSNNNNNNNEAALGS
jgi:cell division protease FtsH